MKVYQSGINLMAPKCRVDGGDRGAHRRISSEY